MIHICKISAKITIIWQTKNQNLKQCNIKHLIYRCKYSLNEGWLGLGASGSITVPSSQTQTRQHIDVSEIYCKFIENDTDKPCAMCIILLFVNNKRIGIHSPMWQHLSVIITSSPGCRKPSCHCHRYQLVVYYLQPQMALAKHLTEVPCCCMLF